MAACLPRQTPLFLRRGNFLGDRLARTLAPPGHRHCEERPRQPVIAMSESPRGGLPSQANATLPARGDCPCFAGSPQASLISLALDAVNGYELPTAKPHAVWYIERPAPSRSGRTTESRNRLDLGWGEPDMDSILPWIIEHKWWFAPLACFVIAIIVVRIIGSQEHPFIKATAYGKGGALDHGTCFVPAVSAGL